MQLKSCKAYLWTYKLSGAAASALFVARGLGFSRPLEIQKDPFVSGSYPHCPGCSLVLRRWQVLRDVGGARGRSFTSSGEMSMLHVQKKDNTVSLLPCYPVVRPASLCHLVRGEQYLH